MKASAAVVVALAITSSAARADTNFFVVSSIKGGKIWYDRCNFTSRYVHRVLINYPAAEKRQWGNVVTRIRDSLSGG